MLCPNCEKPIPEQSAFCHHCGNPIPPRPICPECSLPITAEMLFCPKCGAKTSDLKHPPVRQKARTRWLLLLLIIPVAICVYFFCSRAITYSHAISDSTSNRAGEVKEASSDFGVGRPMLSPLDCDSSLVAGYEQYPLVPDFGSVFGVSMTREKVSHFTSSVVEYQYTYDLSGYEVDCAEIKEHYISTLRCWGFEGSYFGYKLDTENGYFKVTVWIDNTTNTIDIQIETPLDDASTTDNPFY